MSQHLIKYVDDPLAMTPVEIGFEFAPSFELAMEKVAAAMPKIREKHGVLSGYRIEDFTGRTVIIGPGRHMADYPDL